MASVLTEIVVRCREPAEVAAFWSGALGWPVSEYPGGVKWMSRSGASDGELLLVFAPGREAPTNGAQIRLALRPVDTSAHDEMTRLVGLGARPSGDGAGASGWVSLTDPEGNQIILGPPLDEAPGQD